MSSDKKARTPNLFLVGAPKAGTTAMYTYLSQHPDVYMSPVKEPTYFGSDLPGERYCRDQSEYLELFAGATDERWVGEASPWYLLSRQAADEIHRFAPDARIIVMVREPVALIESLHSSALFSGDEHVTDVRRALELEPSRRSGANLSPLARIPQATFYRAVADLAPQIRRYFDVFGRGRVHVVVYDDLARDTTATYAAVLRFLEIDATFRPSLKVVNSNRSIRSKALRRLYLDPPHRLRAAVRRYVPRAVVKRIWTRGLWPVLYAANTYHVDRQPMPDDLREELRREMREPVRRLSELLGRDLTEVWGTGAMA